MSKARAARRLAAAALYGGGGLGVLGGGMWGLMRTQAGMARRSIGAADKGIQNADGEYGSDQPGHPLRVTVLGDSSAAGYGVSDPLDTPAALLAQGLSALASRPVHITCHAKVGAQTSDLERQIELALEHDPQVAVIVVGANDVTHRVRPSESIRLLDRAIHRLQDAGCAVVVGTCPDLGTVQPLQPPLRHVARAWSRRLAAGQMVAIVEAGARAVSLGSLLGEHFAKAPGEFFGPDRFHPSVTGYVSMVTALLPAVAEACEAWDGDEDDTPDDQGLVLPVSFAAVEAARHDGTQVSGTTVKGENRGPRGRWAAVRRRSS